MQIFMNMQIHMMEMMTEKDWAEDIKTTTVCATGSSFGVVASAILMLAPKAEEQKAREENKIFPIKKICM